MSFIKEMWQFFMVRKKFWLLPLVIILGFVGGLVVLAEGSAIAPFIYAVF